MDDLIEHLRAAFLTAQAVHQERRQEAGRARQAYLTERTTSKRMEAVRTYAAEVQAAATYEAVRQAYTDARDLRAASSGRED